MADLSWTDGNPVTQAPRSILNKQIARLADQWPGAPTWGRARVHGFRTRISGSVGGRLPRAEACHRLQRRLRDACVDPDEPLLRDIRLGMDGAGMYCEGVKGECNFGQQEIAFRYDHARVTCDNHTIYKNGAKEIADQHGKSLTFMAKFDEREGNSCTSTFRCAATTVPRCVR